MSAIFASTASVINAIVILTAVITIIGLIAIGLILVFSSDISLN